MSEKKKALLVLADGITFEGWNVGAEGEAIGEVVFNTSMTGYQEILTDASYKGQMVVMTYPQIGNYGVNFQDVESARPQVEGFIVKECFDFPSNWRSQMSLTKYLNDNNIVCMEGIDTRALTKHLRDNGVQMGIVSSLDLHPESLLDKVRHHPGISSIDLVKEVTTKKPFTWQDHTWRWQGEKTTVEEIMKSSARKITALFKGFKASTGKKIVVYDFGIKLNILRHLAETGCDITVVPAHTPAEKVLQKAEGIVLSNGPGDPQTVTYAVEITKKLIGKKPILGICVGHQILGLALVGRTYKLRSSH